MNPILTKFDWKIDLTAQRALFSDSFPENAGQAIETEAYYKRKFRDFPADPPSREFVASDARGLIGYYAAIPYLYNFQGRTFRCGMVCDVMTSPRMQGKGVFTRLGAYSLEQLTHDGFDFVTGYPRRAAVVPGHLKVGWEVLFHLPMYLLPIKVNCIFDRFGVGWMAPFINPLLHILQSTLGIAGAGEFVYEIWGWKEFLESHDYSAFVSAWATTHQITLIKTTEFLRWRLSIQEVDYRIIAVKQGSVLVGLSIVRACIPEGVMALGVLDLMILDEDPRLLRAMRQGWFHLCREWGQEVIIMMFGEYHAKRLGLLHLGFLRTPIKFSFIIKCLSSRAQTNLPMRPEAWHLMWIDSDDL